MKYTIRDLLWLTLATAMALGWFIRERQLRDEVSTWQTRWELAALSDSAACRALLRDVYRDNSPTGNALRAEEFSRQTDGWCRIENTREILLFNVKEKKFTIVRGVDRGGGRHEEFGEFFVSEGEVRARRVGESY